MQKGRISLVLIVTLASFFFIRNIPIVTVGELADTWGSWKNGTKIQEEKYNASAEIQKRQRNLRKWCETNEKKMLRNSNLPWQVEFLALSWRAKYISRFGVSTGKKGFWACFTPKAASMLRCQITS